MNTEDKFYFGKPGQPERFEMVWTGKTTQAFGGTVAASNDGTPIGFKQKAAAEAFIYRHQLNTVAKPAMVRSSKDFEGTWYVGLPRRFSRPGQPERFENTYSGGVMYVDNYARLAAWDNGYAIVFRTESEAKSFISRHRLSTRGAHPMLLQGKWYVRVPEKTLNFSRPGQPERFGLEDACWEGYEPVGTKQKDGRTVPNCVPKDENAGPEEFAHPENIAWMRSLPASVIARVREILSKPHSSARAKALRDTLKSGGVSYNKWIPDSSAGAEVLGHQFRDAFSRPGQPDKFDASSLNRGDFAEASTSPMLGKLLAAKVMPEGGWRAVQVGSDTLVISFEDADLASDFGRRVATKGYNATSPVQAIGRYWNVEVKNGK